MLDEPLGSLDRALRERLLLEIRSILKELRMTAIFVTHDQSEAFSVADDIAVMHAGRVVQADTPESLYMHPQSLFVARFLGFKNLLPGMVVEAGNEARDKVTNEPFKGGERVCTEEMIWCGECKPCADGYPNHCERLDEIGDELIVGELGRACARDVEDLAAQGKYRLARPIARLLGGATG